MMYSTERNDVGKDDNGLNHRPTVAGGGRQVHPPQHRLHHHQQQRSLQAAPNWLVAVELPSQPARAGPSLQLQHRPPPRLAGTTESLLSGDLSPEEHQNAEIQARCDAIAMGTTTGPLLAGKFSHEEQQNAEIQARCDAVSMGTTTGPLLAGPPSQLRHMVEAPSFRSYSHAGGLMNAGPDFDVMGNLSQISRQHVDDQFDTSASHCPAWQSAPPRQSPPLLTPGLSRLISDQDFVRNRSLMNAILSSAQTSGSGPMLRQQFPSGGTSGTNQHNDLTEEDAPVGIREVMPQPSLLPAGKHGLTDELTSQEREHLRNRPFPCVLYLGELDDEALNPYQCYLRKHLELFEADEEDNRIGTRQGRTAPVKIGQVGLRCRHCGDAKVAPTTKGAAYYSQYIENLYQLAQNMSKVHLSQRCKYIPEEDRRQLSILRDSSRRANGGKVYWTTRIRELGVYEDPPVLRAKGHPRSPL